MKNHYRVEVLQIKEVHELPGAWTSDRLKAFLAHLDYDDWDSIPENELKEMASLALSDMSPEEATLSLLEFRLGDRLSKGMRQSLIDDFRGSSSRVWEQFSEIALHEELFNVACMLHWSFPRKFSEPDAVQVDLRITAHNPKAESNLAEPSAAFLARILNDGMDDHNTIHRLYEDNLASDSFAEAKDILWIISNGDFDPNTHSNTFTIHSSWCWLEELKGMQEFDSEAFADGQLHS